MINLILQFYSKPKTSDFYIHLRLNCLKIPEGRSEVSTLDLPSISQSFDLVQGGQLVKRGEGTFIRDGRLGKNGLMAKTRIVLPL